MTFNQSMRKPVLELKHILQARGYELMTPLTDNYMVIYSKGNYDVIIDNDVVEEEIHVQLLKKGLVVYKKQVKKASDLIELKDFAKMN